MGLRNATKWSKCRFSNLAYGLYWAFTHKIKKKTHTKLNVFQHIRTMPKYFSGKDFPKLTNTQKPKCKCGVMIGHSLKIIIL